MALKIKKITKKIDKILTGDIEVEGTHSYQLDNGAVSHNSVLLETASGIHPEHSKKYIRNIQLNKDTEIAKTLIETNPVMVEESSWSASNTDIIASFPIISPKGSLYRKDMMGTNLLEKVKLVQNSWVEEGTNIDLCTLKTLRHNVSNTISVRDGDWDNVARYLYDNRKDFAGVSLISEAGDKDYVQAPNIEVLSSMEIVKKYGRGSLFASGLIVDAGRDFRDIWEACHIALNGGGKENQEDWVRRFNKFADNFFGGDIKETEYCLKDLVILHKWTKIQQGIEFIDYSEYLKTEKNIDIDTMGAQSCSGGACEII